MPETRVSETYIEKDGIEQYENLCPECAEQYREQDYFIATLKIVKKKCDRCGEGPDEHKDSS